MLVKQAPTGQLHEGKRDLTNEMACCRASKTGHMLRRFTQPPGLVNTHSGLDEGASEFVAGLEDQAEKENVPVLDGLHASVSGFLNI